MSLELGVFDRKKPITPYNTLDGTANGDFNNPELWGGMTEFFDGVQFVSGYALPTMRRAPLEDISAKRKLPVADRR